MTADDSSALDAANVVFQNAYGKAKSESERTATLLVALAGKLALHTNGERREFPFVYPPFHTAKVVAHVAVASYAATGALKAGNMPVETVLSLESIRAHVDDALKVLTVGGVEDDTLRNALVPLLESSRDFAQRALAERRVPSAGRDDFARSCGPQILQATEIATAGQVAALHQAFEQVLTALSPDERSSLQVVVVGDHQARTRSLGMQYFQRRFGESEGADDRVTYGENVADEAEAIALVGTRRLDFEIARAFFGDEKRLQRDVLGDAAQHCLDDLHLTPIEPGNDAK